MDSSDWSLATLGSVVVLSMASCNVVNTYSDNEAILKLVAGGVDPLVATCTINPRAEICKRIDPAKLVPKPKTEGTAKDLTT